MEPVRIVGRHEREAHVAQRIATARSFTCQRCGSDCWQRHACQACSRRRLSQYALSHPTERADFATLAIQLGMLTLTAGVCTVLLVQALRGKAGQTPRWTTPAIAGVVGLTLGVLLIGLIAQPEGVAGAAPNTVGTKTVHLAAVSFAPDIIALHKGDTLTIVDDAPIPHTITNGAWSSDNKPVPGIEPGAPVISNVELNSNTVKVGPFTTAGAYHLYCTIHPGMALTIIVQ